MFNREIDGEITHFPYKKMLVTDVSYELPACLLSELGRQLALQTQPHLAEPDSNHMVYKLDQYGAEEPVYIQFSDDIVIFGRSIVPHPDGY